jgi:hypothetical protein
MHCSNPTPRLGPLARRTRFRQALQSEKGVKQTRMNGDLARETATVAKSRLAGIAGLCGALLFFAGDMLFYGHLGSGAGFHEGMTVVVR